MLSLQLDMPELHPMPSEAPDQQVSRQSTSPQAISVSLCSALIACCSRKPGADSLHHLILLSGLLVLTPGVQVLHLSLSRTVAVRRPQIQDLVTKLQRALVKVERWVWVTAEGPLVRGC